MQKIPLCIIVQKQANETIFREFRVFIEAIT